MHTKTLIGISKASGNPNYAHYIHWIEAAAKATGSDVECHDLSTLPSVEAAVEVLARCSGLLLTGGPDVEPSRYGKADELHRCYTDPERDILEFALYQKAQAMNLPVLGVCRGAQLINVAHGGTLVVDIPNDTEANDEHARLQDVDSMHRLEVLTGSLLTKLTGEIEGTINSAHHQAVERLGEGLRLSAVSADGINEGVEWNDTTNKPFLLGVQWHPERMDYDNPFSLPIARHFVFEAESYRLLMRPQTEPKQPRMGSC